MSNNIWIRSQNKYSMTNCNEIYIGDFFDKKDEFSIVGFTDTDTDSKTILGKYSSEEKAIKVLDMIQEHISPLVEISKMPQNNNNIIDLDYAVHRTNVFDNQLQQIDLFNRVFQMPQDNEVEV